MSPIRRIAALLVASAMAKTLKRALEDLKLPEEAEVINTIDACITAELGRSPRAQESYS